MTSRWLHRKLWGGLGFDSLVECSQSRDSLAYWAIESVPLLVELCEEAHVGSCKHHQRCRASKLQIQRIGRVHLVG